MSIKEQAHEIVEKLDDNASWDDLLKSLYLEKKLTLGMTDLELVKQDLNESDVDLIITRLQSSPAQTDGIRSTRTYKPGNATTLGMVAGVVAILFAIVFPPIAWIAAFIATISGGIGLRNQESKAWVPILMAIVSLAPVLSVINN